MRPVILEPTASAFRVAFVDYVIFRVGSLNLVQAPAVVAGFFSVIFYRFGIHNKKYNQSDQDNSLRSRLSSMLSYEVIKDE
mgnify:CR=1 FL=1